MEILRREPTWKVRKPSYILGGVEGRLPSQWERQNLPRACDRAVTLKALIKLLSSIKWAMSLISTCLRTLALLPSKKALCLLNRAATHVVVNNHLSSLCQMLRATTAQKSLSLEHITALPIPTTPAQSLPKVSSLIASGGDSWAFPHLKPWKSQPGKKKRQEGRVHVTELTACLSLLFPCCTGNFLE